MRPEPLDNTKLKKITRKRNRKHNSKDNTMNTRPISLFNETTQLFNYMEEIPPLYANVFINLEGYSSIIKQIAVPDCSLTKVVVMIFGGDQTLVHQAEEFLPADPEEAYTVFQGIALNRGAIVNSLVEKQYSLKDYMEA